MKKSVFVLLVLSVSASVLIGTAAAQRSRFGPTGDRRGVPKWEMNQEFPTDVFTFVRIQYDSHRGGWGGDWYTDAPDSDLNFAYRLQEITSLKVFPNETDIRLTDKTLFDHPFIYIVEPGRLMFRDEEVPALRQYLLRGGFLMVDDFWGGDEWNNFYREIKRVFPDREPQELPLDHEIFNCVYKIKEKPQVPSIHAAYRGMNYEPRYGPDDGSVPHIRAIFDDKGRMMVVICHNTDLGDGWEREGENEQYFTEYSMKKAYPMGINIVFYAMTH
jgi:hypothetical protein